MKIITNNVPRFIKYGYEMPEKFRSDFDYILPEEFDNHDFVEYKGNWYDLSEFLSTRESSGDFAQWHGYAPDSYFSGILVKQIAPDFEAVIIGRYYA